MMLWVFLAALAAVAGGATWYAFSNPQFIAGLTAIVAKAAWKAVAPSLKPKDFTPEQLSKIRRGENPFHDKGKQ